MFLSVFNKLTFARRFPWPFQTPCSPAATQPVTLNTAEFVDKLQVLGEIFGLLALWFINVQNLG